MLATLILLQAMLTLQLWLPDFTVYGLLRPTPEFLVVFLAAFLTGRTVSRWRRLLFSFTLLLACAACFFSVGEMVTRYLYSREFRPLEDLVFFPEFIRLLFTAESDARLFVYTAVFLLAMGLLVALLTVLLYVVSRIAGGTAGAPAAVPAALLFILLLIISPSRIAHDSPAVFRLDRYLRGRDARPEHVAATGIQAVTGSFPHTSAISSDQSATPTPRTLERKPDILLFIIESYGYTVFAKPEHWEILQPLYRDTEDRLREAGYHIRSNFLKSPVRGGYSWYADATLLTGRWVGSLQEYETLLASDRPSLFSVLEAQGYRTALAAPGMLASWPEGENYYKFQRHFYNRDFDYQGPEFSFVPIPDQYALRVIHDSMLGSPRDEPLFILYLLVSSHAPFNRIPPYVPDWSSLDNGSIYHRLDILTFDNNWISGSEYTQGYTAAIRYELTVLTGYLGEFLENDALVVLVGDHQPKRPVATQDQPWSVPIHVISRNESMVLTFENHGYTRGLVPGRHPPHHGMDSFFGHLMDALEVAP